MFQLKNNFPLLALKLRPLTLPPPLQDLFNFLINFPDFIPVISTRIACKWQAGSSVYNGQPSQPPTGEGESVLLLLPPSSSDLVAFSHPLHHPKRLFLHPLSLIGSKWGKVKVACHSLKDSHFSMALFPYEVGGGLTWEGSNGDDGEKPWKQSGFYWHSTRHFINSLAPLDIQNGGAHNRCSWGFGTRVMWRLLHMMDTFRGGTISCSVLFSLAWSRMTQLLTAAASSCNPKVQFPPKPPKSNKTKSQ